MHPSALFSALAPVDFAAWLSAAGAVVLAAFLWLRRERQWRQRAADHERSSRQARGEFRAALDQCHARQNAALESIQEAVLILDAQRRALQANPAFLKLFGISQIAPGQSLLELVRAPELIQLCQQSAGGALETAAITVASGGRRLQLEVGAKPIRFSSQESLGFILAFRDRTRLQQLENVRSEFVANVSHELRTPLSIIKGYVETLLDHPDLDRRTAENFLEKIRRHNERMIFLIEDLLSLAQLESGEIPLDKKMFPLRPFVQQIIEHLNDAARPKEIQIRNEAAEDFQVWADPLRLEQVLWNLLENAIKYGKDAGTVRIQTEKVEPGNASRICVLDDGPGIPAAAQGRLFERFYRVDRARSRHKGGTGLGLAIVKHIVELHGGAVGLDSKPGRGAAFFVVLPAPPANARSG